MEPGAQAPGWWSRWWRQWEHRLAQPQSYQWARSHWYTRWLVRRRTTQLFGWMSGFVQSQVLLASVRLGLLDRLADAPRTARELGLLMSVPEHPLRCLLDSGVAMGLYKCNRAGVYRLGGAGHVLRSQPGITAMIEHNHLLYAEIGRAHV